MLNLALRLPGGEITIPVGLAATKKSAGIEYRRLHKACMTPVEERTWCPTHGQEVAGDELVKAWEVAPGEFVPVDDQELQALVPQAQSSVEIIGFVPATEVAPLLVDRSYYLKPRAEQLGRRTYLLLRAALEQTDTIAVGRLAAWKKEYPCAVRPVAGDSAALLMQTLHWQEDLVPAREIDLDLADAELLPGELELAQQLLERHTKPLEKHRLVSRYRPAERALLERKLADGDKVVVAPAADLPAAPVFDLTQALQRSVRAAPRRPRAKATA